MVFWASCQVYSSPYLTLSLAASRPSFSGIISAGVKVLSYMKFTRKDRFVLAAAAAMGFGNMLVPKWATYLFERVETSNAGLRGLFNSIIIVLSTPCKFTDTVKRWQKLISTDLIGGLVAAILNLIIPEDAPEREDIVVSPSFQDSTLETGTVMPDLNKNDEKGREMDADAEYKARVDPAPEGSGSI